MKIAFPPLESIESHHLDIYLGKSLSLLTSVNLEFSEYFSRCCGGVGVGVGEERSKPSCVSDKSLPAIGMLPCLSGKSWPFTQEEWMDGKAYPAIDVLRGKFM